MSVPGFKINPDLPSSPERTSVRPVVHCTYALGECANMEVNSQQKAKAKAIAIFSPVSSLPLAVGKDGSKGGKKYSS